MKKETFGFVDGKEVKKYTLEKGELTAEIITYGGAVKSLKYPDKNGKITDVVLGYDTVEEYVKNGGYFGALIGRVGNRIGGAKFTLNGKEYEITQNGGGNSLHGGKKGFDKYVWEDKVEGETLILSILSEDNDQGYPGNLSVTVKYHIEDDGLNIEYSAVSDADTVINLTNHTYFNLNGEGNGNVLDTEMYIDSDAVTPVDEKLIPHGEFYPVKGTAFDFNTLKKIGKDINDSDQVMINCKGYDINYALNGEGFRKVAYAKSDVTGIILSVYTDQKGVQFYSGNFLNGVKGKGNSIYGHREGFCLETQNYPNAINCPEYPNAILKKGEKYSTKTVYKLSK